MTRKGSKSHRTGARSVGVYALKSSTTRKSERKPLSVLEEEKEEREKEKEKRVMRSASATLQKQEDVKAAEERALSVIMERRRREAELAKLVPKSAYYTRVAPKPTKNDIDRALEEEAEEEERKEASRERRKEAAKEARRRFNETQKAKKVRKAWIAIEKKHGLEHRSLEKLKEEKLKERLAAGNDEEKAAIIADIYAFGQSEPYMRMMKDDKLTWADILDMEDEEEAKKPKPKPKFVADSVVVDNFGITPLRPNASIRPTRKAADPRKLVILDLPSETGRGLLDIRMLRRSVFGTMTGKEIFPEKQAILKETIVIPKLAGAYTLAKVGQEVYHVKGTGNKLSFSVTYPTVELAKQALAYAKTHPISIKGTRVRIEQAH